MEYDDKILIQILIAQRNHAFDQAAMANAVIHTLQAKIDALTKKPGDPPSDEKTQ